VPALNERALPVVKNPAKKIGARNSTPIELALHGGGRLRIAFSPFAGNNLAHIPKSYLPASQSRGSAKSQQTKTRHFWRVKMAT